MAKYTLTIETDDYSEIARALGITSSPANVVIDTDDDDDGPTNEAPPATDARGYPWDDRIHASSKALNKDGTWRYKRGADKDVIAQVEAELKPDPLAIPPELDRRGDAPVQVPTGEPAPSPVTYEQVIAELTDAMKNGKIAPEGLPAFYQQCGVADATGLVGNQPALDAAHAKLAAL